MPAAHCKVCVWSVKGKGAIGGARGALMPARWRGAVVLSATQQEWCIVAAVADLPILPGVDPLLWLV